jgi:predicted RNase H-like HicB family nuclease
MSFKVLVYEEEDGYWAKVPALPGCATQGDTYDDLMANVKDAISGWLSVEDEDDASSTSVSGNVREERVLVAA